MEYKPLLPTAELSHGHPKNEEMLDMVYGLYYHKLFKIAYAYVSSKEDTEEIVQDVFLKLWKKQDEIHAIENLTGYLYKMTRNSCLDFLRSKKNKLAIGTNIIQQENLLNFYALSSDPASIVIEKELQVQIDKAIGQLPEKCKLVFTKSRVEGLKHKEISDSLNISTKTIENHITKALRYLKTYLKEYR